MSDAKTVLIVDDEPDAVEFATAALGELEGIVVLSAGDGLSGLAKAKEVGPDLIILDVQMPGKEGFDVFVDLKKDEATRDIPVVMLTGVAEKVGIGFSAKDMKEFLGGEPQAYLEKPINPVDLQDTVRRLLGL